LHSAKDVDEETLHMRERIEGGELDGERSYVTRWNDDERRVEVVAGKWCEQEAESTTSSSD
jgi:hypothetical protein